MTEPDDTPIDMADLDPFTAFRLRTFLEEVCSTMPEANVSVELREGGVTHSYRVSPEMAAKARRMVTQ